MAYDITIPDETTPYLFIQGDFSREEKFEEILKANKIDTIYHLISTTVPCEGTVHVIQEIEDNVIPTVRLLEAMKLVGVKRIIFSSSGGTVYGESKAKGRPNLYTDSVFPICSYGIQKVSIEYYLNLYNYMHRMMCFSVRISNPYGYMPQKNRTQGVIPILLTRLLLDSSITLYGETIRDYIHISDVIEALLRIGYYESNQRTFNIGSGIPTNLHKLIPLMEEAAGKKFSNVLKQNIRKCDVYECILDISETVRELNWEPRISLNDGIRITLGELKRSLIK